MRDSKYLSADVKPIDVHDLTLVYQFIFYLSGSKSLPNGGAFIVATSTCNSPRTRTLGFALQVAEAKQYSPAKLRRWNPYTHADTRVSGCLKNIKVFKIGGMSKDEVRAVTEYYTLSGMLRSKVDDAFISEKWSLARMGNIGALEMSTARMRIRRLALKRL